MECLHCGKKLNVLRQLHGQEFCSAAHRKAYLRKQDDLAVDFLIQSKPRYTRESLPAPDSAPEAELDVIPLPANFVVVHIAPVRVASTPLFTAVCDWTHPHPVL